MSENTLKLTKRALLFLDKDIDNHGLEECLSPIYHLQTTESACSTALLLDTFDNDLRLSGRLLTQAQDSLWLFTANSGSVQSQPCPVEWRFAADLSDGPVRRVLAEISALRAFLPVLSAFMRVVRIEVCDDEEKTHVRGQWYEYQDTESQPRTIVTLAPLRGYTRANRLLKQALCEQGACVLTSVSDVYAELGVTEPIYQAKPVMDLEPDAPACEAVRLIMQTFLRVARRNEAGIAADADTEFLHDYRVSLRKVRSILSLCKKICHANDAARLKQTLAATMKPTNRLRDLDVYLLEKTHYLSLVPEALRPGLEIMFASFAVERQQHVARVSAMFQSESYTQTLDELARQFDSPHLLEAGPQSYEPAKLFARRLIWKRYKKVCDVAGQITADSPDDDVHDLRIQCKKLRYAMEFFVPLFPEKSIKQRIKELKQLQDNLGRFNDYAVQQHALHEFLHSYSRHHADAFTLAGSIGALIAVLYQQQQAERRQVVNNFQHFGSAGIRTAFAGLCAEEVER